MDHGALLGKEVWRERQRPEATVVALAVVWTSEQGGDAEAEAGEARTGDAEVGRDGERSEAEGLRAAKAPKPASRAGEGM